MYVVKDVVCITSDKNPADYGMVVSSDDYQINSMFLLGLYDLRIGFPL